MELRAPSTVFPQMLFCALMAQFKICLAQKILKKKEDKKKKSTIKFPGPCPLDSQMRTNCATGKQPLREPLFLIFILFYN